MAWAFASAQSTVILRMLAYMASSGFAAGAFRRGSQDLTGGTEGLADIDRTSLLNLGERDFRSDYLISSLPDGRGLCRPAGRAGPGLDGPVRLILAVRVLCCRYAAA
jgi:hypothetical protein